MKTLLATVALACVCVEVGGCNKQNYELVPCGNGNVVAKLNNDQVFDLYASEVKFELNAALSTKGQIVSASAGTKYENDVKQLYEQLDNLTAQFKTELYAEYGVFLSQFCSATTPDERQMASNAWSAARQQAMQYAIKVRELNKQAAVIQTGSSNTLTQLAQFVTLGKQAAEASKLHH